MDENNEMIEMIEQVSEFRIETSYMLGQMANAMLAVVGWRNDIFQNVFETTKVIHDRRLRHIL